MPELGEEENQSKGSARSSNSSSSPPAVAPDETGSFSYSHADEESSTGKAIPFLLSVTTTQADLSTSAA